MVLATATGTIAALPRFANGDGEGGGGGGDSGGEGDDNRGDGGGGGGCGSDDGMVVTVECVSIVCQKCQQTVFTWWCDKHGTCCVDRRGRSKQCGSYGIQRMG